MDMGVGPMKNFLKVMKLAPMRLVTFPVYAIASWLVNILAWLLSPLLAAWSVIAGINKLPPPFNLLHTHDNTLDGGQNQGYKVGVKGVRLWWQRTCWICRNPGYGFKAYVLGFKTAGHKLIWANPLPKPVFDDVGGLYYWYVMEDAEGRRYWGYRANYKFTKKRYIKQWIGWHYYPYDGIHQQLKSHLVSIKRLDEYD